MERTFRVRTFLKSNAGGAAPNATTSTICMTVAHCIVPAPLMQIPLSALPPVFATWQRCNRLHLTIYEFSDEFVRQTNLSCYRVPQDVCCQTTPSWQGRHWRSPVASLWPWRDLGIGPIPAMQPYRWLTPRRRLVTAPPFNNAFLIS